VRNQILCILLIFPGLILGQKLSGTVKDQAGNPLLGVNVQLSGTEIGTSTNELGEFDLELKEGYEGNLVISFIGYRSQSIPIQEIKGQLEVILIEDRLGLEEIVVSGNREAISRYQNPIIIETLNPELFDQVAALSLAEGLSFSPGLRIENNCQNCGFTQVRLNGMEGAYSQILLNSRPVFSSLMAVYGLEMIPANMIERVEVVRGGGSVLYGGNAIGGTVNIITSEPKSAGFHSQTQIQSIAGEAWERSQSVGFSTLSKDGSFGLQSFAFIRDREPWDANQDGFSEITNLQNLTLGLNATWKPKARTKLSTDLFLIDEFRRGGSDFDLLPHQSRVAEQLEHYVVGGGLSWEQLSANSKHLYSIYGSALQTQRASYYGAGGRVLNAGDSLTEDDLLALNAYGNTRDLSSAMGTQYSWKGWKRFQITLGSEWNYNEVKEEMPGYTRYTNQTLSNWGTYAQILWNPNSRWKIQAGNRLDISWLDGNYRLLMNETSEKNRFINLAPRFSLQYQANENWQLRTSYAQGFRVPQAFNEDLHIETVGGAALFVLIGDDLVPETSHSINSSLEYLIINNKHQHKIVLSGFYTILENPFVLIDRQALDNGTSAQTKTNGQGALVRGASIEYQGAIGMGLQIDAAFTAQENLYQEDLILWESNVPDDNLQVSTSEMLRSPNLYGYLRANYNHGQFGYSAALNYTGGMLLSRLIDLETEEIELLRSPEFFDLQASVEYRFYEKGSWNWSLKGGVKNIFNAFQKDLPVGADRDASYIYGPLLPRTYFLSIKLDLQP